MKVLSLNQVELKPRPWIYDSDACLISKDVIAV